MQFLIEFSDVVKIANLWWKNVDVSRTQGIWDLSNIAILKS